ncbi:MAG TPA: VOC family protein [Solirubrobacteraceae bacterium]|nr:VOC family protein [Solirubrobacteraceae bacterium]
MTTAIRFPYVDGSHSVLPDALRLGAVRLAVTNLDRSVAFYTTVLGLDVASRGRMGAHEVAHLAADGEEVVVLQEEPGARRAGRHAGLYHVAYLFPTRLELARALRRIAESRTPIEGASDHQTHDAIYLPDPDGNGLELAWDWPRERWPETLDLANMRPHPLDLDGLLALTAHEPLVSRAAPGLRVGHVHLHVGDVQRTIAFYVDLLGLELQFDLGTGAFMSAGGYHHHLGANTWRGQGVPPMPPNVVGLREWRIYLPTATDVAAARQRLAAGGVATTSAGDTAFTTIDPWGIQLHVGVDPKNIHSGNDA